MLQEGVRPYESVLHAAHGQTLWEQVEPCLEEGGEGKLVHHGSLRHLMGHRGTWLGSAIRSPQKREKTCHHGRTCQRRKLQEGVTRKM
jgi:hypothetical protein